MGNRKEESHGSIQPERLSRMEGVLTSRSPLNKPAIPYVGNTFLHTVK